MAREADVPDWLMGSLAAEDAYRGDAAFPPPPPTGIRTGALPRTFEDYLAAPRSVSEPPLPGAVHYGPDPAKERVGAVARGVSDVIGKYITGPFETTNRALFDQYDQPEGGYASNAEMAGDVFDNITQNVTGWSAPFRAFSRGLTAGAGGGRLVQPTIPREAPGGGMGSLAEAPSQILPGDLRASTRFPTGARATEDPLRQHLSIGLKEMQDTPGYMSSIAALDTYPGFARLREMGTDEAARAYIRQAAGNLDYLYRRSPDVMKERSPLWYEGAHEISDALARRWGVPRQSSSAALASLSPQMDWFKNASLGERTGDIMTSAAAGRILTPEMEGFARQAKFLESPQNLELYRSIAGKSLDQLETPLQKALWIRLYDEAHNPRSYRTITPEGRFGDFVVNQGGEPAKVGWGALGEIQKAVRALESGGAMDIISPALGTKHKVRSFYNNIENPYYPYFGDVTIDTHQVAAGQMRPLSGASPAVQHNLASGGAAGSLNVPSSDITGVQGTYGLIADATRRMAAEHGLLPRAAQSATWEPVRELFGARFKADPRNKETIDNIWRAYDRGDISIEQARDAVFNAAGGIGTPSWARPGLRTFAPSQASTYR
jgi:hypothetical protein